MLCHSFLYKLMPMIFICYISRLVPQQHRKKVGVTSQDISGMAKIIFS